jgi:YbgC/YbaW family acyl-CoA thioester hydrolase
MAHTFRDRRRIEFYETDMAGIVHFSNYFRFMESTEHAFFRSLGLALHHHEGADMSGWARVDARCQYRQPLRYMDEVEVELRVRAKKRSSLAYDFVFRRVGDRNGPIEPDEVAHGALEVVHVTSQGGGPMRASAMPDDVAHAIEVAPKVP